jgi:hypothetical protein
LDDCLRPSNNKRHFVTGTPVGDGNSSTLTYSFGGAAVGLDYRFDPLRLVRRSRTDFPDLSVRHSKPA